ncbi:hypothetical protein CONPUDRAFT_160183 [Coniophora puteana RWD-64-598 SS2]|uniref:Uncharacterized protein n=1 Tax=Coniophora puteana (strain RWD-64-598) TaxID=741705 RepID=R7SFG2_CONPW|nr:uncharacterized protein CONPUDRAFT_160183 [Coniophora puteana RWD-64-598 SS2]EIW74482.1 hypothetical protein CONPUDRAFT_160183 [Coniophora puteana RWD-64-598 SS2]
MSWTTPEQDEYLKGVHTRWQTVRRTCDARAQSRFLTDVDNVWLARWPVPRIGLSANEWSEALVWEIILIKHWLDSYAEFRRTGRIEACRSCSWGPYGRTSRPRIGRRTRNRSRTPGGSPFHCNIADIRNRFRAHNRAPPPSPSTDAPVVLPPL